MACSQKFVQALKVLYIISDITSNLSSVIKPGVNSVTGRAQIRLSKFIFFGPAKWCIAQTLLDNCMEPSQQEVQTSTLIGSLWKNGLKKKKLIKLANIKDLFTKL